LRYLGYAIAALLKILRFFFGLRLKLDSNLR